MPAVTAQNIFERKTAEPVNGRQITLGGYRVNQWAAKAECQSCLHVHRDRHEVKEKTRHSPLFTFMFGKVKSPKPEEQEEGEDERDWP